MNAKALAIVMAMLALAEASLMAQPVITTQSTNQVVALGSNVTFSVVVSGTGPFSYQWQLNGTNLPNNVIATVAGNGTESYSGDGGMATNTGLGLPTGVAVDVTGNFLIVDKVNCAIHRMGTNGIITTVAGSNVVFGYSGDGGMA